MRPAPDENEPRAPRSAAPAVSPTAAASPALSPATDSSAGALRVIAGLGLLLAFGALVFSGLLALVDAHETDGRAGGLVGTGLLVLLPAGLFGLFAAALPRDGMSNTVRGWFVALQYALILLSPVLVAADG
ncbi:hypothetical protein [Streptomyces tsukubensis]|uniref:hypothetical protein n=1 Tax=Streptomyces tsukubensis TaxID=83656 RepID=UPI00344CB6FF